MKESIINNKIISAMLGVLIIGGVAALFSVYHSVKDVEHSLEFVSDEDNEDIFV